jgi:hypothetical protein
MRDCTNDDLQEELDRAGAENPVNGLGAPPPRPRCDRSYRPSRITAKSVHPAAAHVAKLFRRMEFLRISCKLRRTWAPSGAVSDPRKVA